MSKLIVDAEGKDIEFMEEQNEDEGKNSDPVTESWLGVLVRSEN